MNEARRFIGEAVRLSREGMEKGEGAPFGAVVVRNGKIVGRSWNKTFISCDPTAHAEIEAIRDACRELGTQDLSGCAIYCSGEPCPMCLAAIYWSNIETIYFANTREEAAAAGFNDAKIYRELLKESLARTVPEIHVPHEHARDVFREWTGKMRQQPNNRAHK